MEMIVQFDSQDMNDLVRALRNLGVRITGLETHSNNSLFVVERKARLAFEQYVKAEYPSVQPVSLHFYSHHDMPEYDVLYVDFCINDCSAVYKKLLLQLQLMRKNKAYYQVFHPDEEKKTHLEISDSFTEPEEITEDSITALLCNYQELIVAYANCIMRRKGALIAVKSLLFKSSKVQS
ncbi:MAG: hypothetical protein IKE65_06400 [Clostridia bacterium]|nr:hypothetical protein [Clostridia bacterium]